jgi:hypothetical protein
VAVLEESSGAKASDEEFDTIVNYLTKYFGKDQPPDKSN